ncbi:MAG: beta strand repeat-containing protein [Acidobacteriota bacterium]
MKSVPGVGSHSYKAVFVGTTSNSASTSTSVPLTVNPPVGAYPTATSIQQSGTIGNYTLTAFVAGYVHSETTGSPTGDVSFVDTTNGNAVLATAPLESGTYGLSFLSNSPATGSSPDAVAIADLNGDGFPDIIVANYSVVNGVAVPQPLTVLLGKGDGTFVAAPASLSVFAPMAIAVADLNSDGIPDLVVSNVNNTITILLGKGDGTFTQAANSPITVGTNPFGVAIGDFNGDGIPDIATANFADATVTILLGNGDGTFTQTPNSPLKVGNGPANPAVADFNGDGIPDIAVADVDDNAVTILLGKGDGTFIPATGSPVKVGTSPTPVVAADFNGDGHIDLAVANYGDSTVTILLGNGDGTFAQSSSSPLNTGTYPYSAVAGDFNADGIPDLVCANQGGTVTILLGKGDGTFTPASNSPVAVGNLPYSVATADLNGDGTSDLAVANNISNSVSIVLSMISQSAIASTTGIAPSGSGTHNVLASYQGSGSFSASASGTTPLIVPPALATTTTTLALTSGNGPATAVPQGTVVTLTATVTAAGAPVTSGQVNFCDASAKSCTDVHLLGTTALNSSGEAILKLRPGVGTHSYDAVFVKTESGTQNDAASISPAAALTVNSTAVPPYPTTTTIVESGSVGNYSLNGWVTGYPSTWGGGSLTGNVSFIDTSEGNSVLVTAPLLTSSPGIDFLSSQLPVPTGGAPNSIVTGDFNGDGIADIAVVNDNSNAQDTGNTITIFLGKGDGTFTQVQKSAAVGSIPFMAAVGDFNEDGISDLAVVNQYDDTISILLGNGDGTFTEASGSPIVVGLSPTFIAVGDFNGDGIPDLAVSNTSSNSVSILLGKGNGEFIPARNSPVTVGSSPASISVGDFNRDGILDLAVVDYTGAFKNGSVSILLGNGDGTFQQAANSPIDVGKDPYSVAMADFNGDGNLDLAIANYGAFTISMLLGKGDGTFTSAANSPFNVNGADYLITTGDFNRDGIPDLAVLDYQSGIQIELGKGDGTFQAAAPFTTHNPQGFATADFDGDGLSDLAIANIDDGVATVGLARFTQRETAFVQGVAPPQPGTHNVEASYAGSSDFSPSISTTVALTGGAAPSFTITGTSVTLTKGATTGNTSTITITPAGGFTGSVALTAALTSSPTGAQYPPTLSFGSTSPVSITSTSAGTATLTVSTTAATSAALAYPKSRNFPWYAAGSTLLAGLLLFGIPAGRHSWRTMLGMLFLLVALGGGLVACGGGSSGGGGGGGGSSNPGTTAGAYAVTVTGTSGSLTQTTTLTVTVN